MKWHGVFSFIVPPGLLLVFPELSLVHCGRADAMDKCEEKDSYEEYRNSTRTADYVEIGPQTYNTESHDFERPWPFWPRIGSTVVGRSIEK
jgi:hypothetical protein